MKPKFNFWLEVGDEVALSIWRVNLLDAIAQTGSISAAAVKMEIPYRIAWQKIREMENRLGEKLVETQTGGKEGGGSKLTPLALEYIAKFKQYHEDALDYLQTRYQVIFLEK